MNREQPSAALLHAALSVALVALSTAATAQSIYRTELVTNGDAESMITEGWSTHDASMQVTRTNTALSGKRGDYFFRGPEGTAFDPAPSEVSMFQSISLGEAGGDIDAGHVALGFSALMGGLGAGDSSVAVHLTFMNALSAKLDSAEIMVNTAHRKSKDLLALRTTTVCDVPAKTRQVILTVTFRYTPGTLHSSDAAIDGMSLRVLNRLPPTFAPLDNLVPSPSAETPAITCLWGTPELGIAPAVTGADGFYVFAANSSGKVTSSLWIDVSADSAVVDANNRHVSLSALIGGGAGASAQASLAFFDKDKNAIDVHMALNTGEVKPDERHFMPVVLQRDQGGAVPAKTRWLCLELVFFNAGVSAAAAVDALVVRIRPRDTMPPTGPTDPPHSPIFRRELLVNGNADERPTEGWLQKNVERSNVTLLGKKGHFFFRGPSDSAVDAEMSQDVDLSEITDQIKKANVAVGLSMWIGSASSMGDSVSVYVTAMDADYESLDERVVDADSEERLTYHHIALCQLDALTTFLQVFVVLTPGLGAGNAAAIDALSLRLVQDTPVKFEDDANLIPAPSAESPAAACLWANANVSVTPAYYGGDGNYQYSAAVPGLTVGTRKIDISTDGAAIDDHSRLAILSALIGGDGPGDQSGRVAVTFLDKDDGELAHLKTADLTAAERDGKSELVKRSTLTEIPSHARFARVDLEFVGEGASVDLVDLRIQNKAGTLAPSGPTEPPTSVFPPYLINVGVAAEIGSEWQTSESEVHVIRSEEAVSGTTVSDIYGRQLIVNGDANEEIGDEWTTTDTEMFVIRSSDELAGKNGEFFFRGPRGEDGEDAQDYIEFSQVVDISEASMDIDAGEVAFGFSAMAGAASDVDVEVLIMIIFADSDDESLDSHHIHINEEDHVYLAPLEWKACTAPAGARRVKVTVVLDYYTGNSNDAAVDDISLRLLRKTAQPYAVDTNLVPLPSAENPVAMCIWDSPVLNTVPVYPGGDGVFQYGVSVTGRTTVALEVDVAPEAREIDSDKRFAVISGLTGGAGGGDDSVSMALTFLDDSNKPIGDAPALVTDPVTAAERGELDMLLQRSAHMMVPQGTRTVKYELIFHNSPTTHSAGVDSLDFRLRHEPGTLPPTKRPTGPSTLAIYGRELVVNGGAEEEVGAPWQVNVWDGNAVVRSVILLDGKVGSHFFRGPLGSIVKPAGHVVTMNQPIDAAEAGDDIDRGQVAAGLSAMVGCLSGDECTATLYLTYYDTEYESLGEAEMSAAAADRGYEGKLVSKMVKECQLPKGTRALEVYVSFEHEELLHNNDAAIDAISLHLLKTTSVWFQEEINLLPAPSAETPAALCVWDETKIEIAPAYPGADGRWQFQAKRSEKSMATKWINMAPAAKEIDEGTRFGVVSALIGGSDWNSYSGHLDVTFCDQDKNPIGDAPSMSTGELPAANRGHVAGLRQATSGVKLPVETRWAKVDMAFHNGLFTTGAAIDELEFSVRSALPPPIPKEKPTETVYVRNLVKNPEANAKPADGWFDGSGHATAADRSTAGINGKSGEYFFRGPKGTTGAPAPWTVPMVQAIDLSSIAEDIDAGTVAVGLSAVAGRMGTSLVASVTLELAAIDADDVELKNKLTKTSALWQPPNTLTRISIDMCQLPVKTRKLEVHVRLNDFFTLLDNDAAVDAIEVRVIQTGLRKYVDGANLVPMPSAESPVATCVWEGEHLAIRSAYEGGGGSGMQYQSTKGGFTNATAWVDISSAGATIDAEQRVALLDAYVGGDGALEDSGEVTVTFFDINKHVLGHAPSMTTGTVTSAERGENTRLLQREATLMVPHGARWAKVMMVFANTALTDGAAVDDINLRLLHKLPTPPPSGPSEPPLESIYARQLIKNGEARYLPKTGWQSASVFSGLLVTRSSQSLPGKSGLLFFRGPKATQKKPAAEFTSMYQEVDLSEAAADVDNGLVALGFSTRAGAAAVGGASVSISLTFMSADGTYLGEPILRTIDKQARGEEAKLIEVEYKACTAPSTMRTVGVTVEFRQWGTLLDNDAAADALSLRIVKKEPVPFVLGANLLPMPSAESPAATCLWGGDNLTTTAVFPGGDGTLQYSSMATGLSTVALWVDLSADTAGIASGDRHVTLAAFVGGSGAEQNSGELVVTLCDKDKNPIGTVPTMTTGVVTAADRNSLPHLLVRNADATVPADARWAKVEMTFHNALTSKFAALDTLDFRILPAPPTLAPHSGPPQGHIFKRELVHNGNADYEPSVGWVSSEVGPLRMLRSDDEMPGKTGEYFFRGVVGTLSKKATSLTSASQMIDLSEAATGIDLGQVSAGFHAALGSLHSNSASVTIFVKYFDDGGMSLAVTPKSVKVGAPNRFGQALLLPRYMQHCTVPAKARKTEVLVVLEHFGNEKDNDAAFDDVSLRLYKKEPVVFVEDANLAPFPHAEATFAPCAWEGDLLTLRRSAPGADGSLEYTAELGGETKATVWVDMSASAINIDKSLRNATLAAHVGGSGTEDDSGEVSVTFFDVDKKPLAGVSALATGTVSAADRANEMKLLKRSAEILVPVGARWAQLAMLFHNLNESRSTAAVDNIDFRILPVGQTPLTPTDPSTLSPVTQSPMTKAPSDSASAAGAPTTAPTPVTPTPATPTPLTPTPAAGGSAASSGAPVRPLAVGFRAGAQAVGGVAFAGSAVAGPVAAAQVGRTVALVAAAAGCGRGSAAGDVAPLWPLSPFQMKVGASTPGAYYRGAVIGNVIAVALVALLLVGIVAALKVLRFSASTQPWHAAMAAVCFPSCLVVPVGLLTPGLMYGAIGAVTANGAGGDYLCAVLAIAIVCGAIGATAYFALTASRGTLDAMEFMVDDTQAGGVAWLLSDAGNWVSTTNQVGAQQQATLQMATMLYRPYRGVPFLWWVPVDLAVTAAVAGAAGAAGAGCRRVSIVLALFLGIQTVAVLALRPHTCRMRNTLVALAGVLATVAAGIFAAVAHRNDADPVRLAHDGLLRLVAVLAIIGALLFLLDGVLSAVKLLLECRKREDAAANTNIELLFGGNLGQELVSDGMTGAKGPRTDAKPPIMELADRDPIASISPGDDDDDL